MKTYKIILLITTAVIFLGSCIKENRENCPSWLTIDLSKVDTATVSNLSIFIINGDKKICKEIYLSKDLIKENIEVELERKGYWIYSWGNISKNTILNSQSQTLEIVPESCADSLYFDKSYILATAETNKTVVLPEKNYINIKVFLEGIEKNDEYSIFFESETSGYFINGEKILKNFKISAPYNEFSSANIIRQFDYNKLNLLIYNNEHNIKIPIGELIMNDPPAGFPEKLSDITLKIDFSQSILTIEIEGWKKIFENFCKIF